MLLRNTSTTSNTSTAFFEDRPSNTSTLASSASCYPVQKYRTRSNRSHALQISIPRQNSMTNSIRHAELICIAIATSTILLQFIVAGQRRLSMAPLVLSAIQTPFWQQLLPLALQDKRVLVPHQQHTRPSPTRCRRSSTRPRAQAWRMCRKRWNRWQDRRCEKVTA